MIQAYKVLVEPEAKKLERMLNAKYSEDYMVIPVRVKYASGTTVTVEDGIVTDCDHKGAKQEEMTVPLWNEDAHIFEPTGSKTETVCDSCGAWQDETGEWNG